MRPGTLGPSYSRFLPNERKPARIPAGKSGEITAAQGIGEGKRELGRCGTRLRPERPGTGRRVAAAPFDRKARVCRLRAGNTGARRIVKLYHTPNLNPGFALPPRAIRNRRRRSGRPTPARFARFSPMATAGCGKPMRSPSIRRSAWRRGSGGRARAGGEDPPDQPGDPSPRPCSPPDLFRPDQAPDLRH